MSMIIWLRSVLKSLNRQRARNGRRRVPPFVPPIGSGLKHSRIEWCRKLPSCGEGPTSNSWNTGSNWVSSAAAATTHNPAATLPNSPPSARHEPPPRSNAAFTVGEIDFGGNRQLHHQQFRQQHTDIAGRLPAQRDLEHRQRYSGSNTIAAPTDADQHGQIVTQTRPVL